MPLRPLLIALLLASSAPARAGTPDPPPSGEDEADKPAEIEVPAEPRGAAFPARLPRDPSWDVWGHARLRFDTLPGFPLDREGTESDHRWWLSSRIVAGGEWRPVRNALVRVELELLSGQIAGSESRLGSAVGPDTFRVSRGDNSSFIKLLPRQAYFSTFDQKGVFAIGLQSFHWGLGMLSHSGQQDGWFGDAEQGNVQVRIGGTATPFRSRPETGLARGLSFSFAGDFVIRDDNAWLTAGDVAAGGLFALRLAGPRGELGLLAAGRLQQDREDPGLDERARTWVVPIDLYGRLEVTRPESPVHLELALEAAFVNGNTTRIVNETTVDGGARVQSWGAVGQLQADFDRRNFSLILLGGAASGDNDPRDAVSRRFSFHSDFDVGLILFDHVLPLVTARAADQLADPALTGTPPGGLRFLVDQGQIAGAMFIAPVLRWRVVDILDIRVGAVLARATADLIDPYQSTLAGGYNTSWGLRSPGSRDLGAEVDGSVRLVLDLPPAASRARIEVGVEAGVFVPGIAFEGIGGDAAELPSPGRSPIGTFRGRLDFRW